MSNLQFTYEIINEPTAISNRDSKNVATILSIDATLTVKIIDEVYFKADIAILEFYKALLKWKQEVTTSHIPAFHYYSIEHDDYEDGAILSMLPFADKARITTVWAEVDIYNVFDQSYAVSELMELEARLKRDLENYFQIDLEKFVRHIPYVKDTIL
ncbi:hypothetical protein B4U37_03180 [Sutcliffiella horikoshii]|uniref:DUF7878 domain-containing protein n=1 Tax=Sutcliffiella horikoshii TaxID=79883 RepID=A0ABM6KF19_9BACI|nr:hypothetical protein [Sutcliffiella horikoshii]ART75107.1 hypothetical protein B4U37_03180 [Sutcliffiella horikoshii]